MPEPKGLEGDEYKRHKADSDRLQEQSRKDGIGLLSAEPWADDLISLYCDRKDWHRDGPEFSTQYVKDAFRAIREGSCGLLGNPPLL